MKIQRALVGDAESILKLQKRAYCSEAEIYSDYNIPPLMQTLDEIKQEFMHHVFLKAVKKMNISLVQCVLALRKKQHILDD